MILTCLFPSFTLCWQVGKTLSPRRWHAAFSEDGHLDIAGVLRRIQRGVKFNFCCLFSSPKLYKVKNNVCMFKTVPYELNLIQYCFSTSYIRNFKRIASWYALLYRFLLICKHSKMRGRFQLENGVRKSYLLMIVFLNCLSFSRTHLFSFDSDC